MLKKHLCPSRGLLKPFAFRRSKSLIDAERLVIPANPGSGSGAGSGIQEKELYRACWMPDRARHDRIVAFNQPILEPIVL
jgi:hypothetical protein